MKIDDTITLSICIPTYNQTKYLAKTLDSISQQTFQDFELIVSDDSTNEDVCKLVKTYSAQMNLLYFRNRPSLGSPENWNHAISHAKGRWIKIMHHDDWFCEKNALEKIVKKAYAHPNSVVFAGIKGEILLEGRSYINLPSTEKVKSLQSDPFSLIWANVIGPPSTIMYPKTTTQFDKNLIWLVDIEFYLQLILKEKLELNYLEEVLFENCQDDHNITNKCFQNKRLELREFNFIYNKFFPKASIVHRFRFLQSLKVHISNYSKINWIELCYAHLIYKPK